MELNKQIENKIIEFSENLGIEVYRSIFGELFIRSRGKNPKFLGWLNLNPHGFASIYNEKILKQYQFELNLIENHYKELCNE